MGAAGTGISDLQRLQQPARAAQCLPDARRLSRSQLVGSLALEISTPPVELYEVQLDGLFPATVQLQAVPLSVNAVGTELVPLQFAVKPTPV
jgi:hypothetical protein